MSQNNNPTARALSKYLDKEGWISTGPKCGDGVDYPFKLHIIAADARQHLSGDGVEVLVQLAVETQHAKAEKGCWIHVSCVEWMPEAEENLALQVIEDAV